MATTAVTTEAPTETSPKAEVGNDPTGEDLIGYSDDELEESAEQPSASAKAAMHDLPGATEMTASDVDLGIDLSEDFTHMETAGLMGESGIDILDDGNTWDLQADVDTTLDSKTNPGADLGFDDEALYTISGAAGDEEDEYGNEDFPEAPQKEDTVPSEAMHDQTAETGIAESISAGSSLQQVEQVADDLHEIDYDDEGAATALENDLAEPQIVNDDAADDSGTVAREVNPFVGAEDAGGVDSTFQKDDQGSTDPPRLNTKLMEDRALEEALDDALYGESSAASLDTPMDEGDLPEVVVYWHGVEYPLLYDSPGSEGKQCFFEDAKLLHCAIEELLASFRRELADDLSATDELVLQINEMGLEFAESSNPENFRDITLNNILQVFNDLVKNQDPDASRPLYTYLITRTSCNTRWHTLIEDAYQGKNIDEVSICFPSAQYATSGVDELPDESDGAGESEQEDQGMGESESGDVDDENSHESANREGDVVDGEEVGQEVAEYVSFENQDDEEQAQDGFESQTADATETGSNEQPDNVPQSHPEEEVAEAEVNTSTPGAGVMHGNDEDDVDGEAEVEGERDVKSPPPNAILKDEEEETQFRLESFSRAEVARIRAAREKSPAMANPSSRHAYHISDGSISFSVTTDADRPHQEDTGADEIYSGHDDKEPSLSVGAAGFEGEEEDAAKVTSDTTSATATMDGDDTADNLNGDFDLDADIGEGPEQGDVGGLEEIDWRDYAGEGDADITQEPIAMSTKRPRSDDEDGAAEAEQEHDVKRRRSDA